MDVVRTGEYYPVALGELVPDGYKHSTSRVRATGIHRLPRAKEWYLSGAKVEGYRALHDFERTEYHIGELVKGEMVSYWQPVEN